MRGMRKVTEHAMAIGASMLLVLGGPVHAQTASQRAESTSEPVHVAAAPSDASPLKTAEELYAKGEYDLARERLRAAAAADASDAQPYLLLGLVELRRNDAAAAAAAWQRYRELSKDPRAAQEIGKMQTIVAREAAERAAKDAVAREQQIQGQPSSSRTVAVATFRNAGTAEFGTLGKALAAMLIDNLSALPGVTVLEREQVEALEAEAKLSGTGLVEKGTAVRAGKLLRAGRVAAGSHANWTGSPMHLRLDALLVDVNAGSTVAEGKSEALATEFFKLVPDVAAKFAGALGTEPKRLPEPALKKLTEEHTHSLEAAVAFGKALDGLDRHDTEAALQACKEVEKADPSFQLAKRKCLFVPPVWLSTQGVISAVEPTAIAAATTGGSLSVWGPVIGALVAGGVAGGTYAAVSSSGGGGGNNGGSTPGSVNGNNTPQLNGAADRTVGAGTTASIDLSCRDPDGTTTTIANPQRGPGATFTQTSGNPATAHYVQPTTPNQAGQTFTATFICTDSGTPVANTQVSASVRVVQPAEVTPTPAQPKPTSPPASSTPTPAACLPQLSACSVSNSCCSGACGPVIGAASVCCTDTSGGCLTLGDCCQFVQSDCIAGACCVVNGAVCVSNADCCTSNCCSNGIPGDPNHCAPSGPCP